MRPYLMASAVAVALVLAGCNKKPESTNAPGQAQPSAAAAPAPAASPAAPTAPPIVANPYANATFTDPKLQAGHDVFQKWCAPCHAPGSDHPGTQALAAKYKGSEPDALEARKDLTADLVKYFVRNGVSIMPPSRKTEISDQDLDNLAAYLSRPH